MKQNWFDTLNESLASENLIDVCPLGLNISYNSSVDFITDDFLYVSVYRNSNGRYERPVSYRTV